MKEHGKAQIEIFVTVKSNYNSTLLRSNVIIKIPTQKSTAIWNIRMAIGSGIH